CGCTAVSEPGPEGGLADRRAAALGHALVVVGNARDHGDVRGDVGGHDASSFGNKSLYHEVHEFLHDFAPCFTPYDTRPWTGQHLAPPFRPSASASQVRPSPRERQR